MCHMREVHCAPRVCAGEYQRGTDFSAACKPSERRDEEQDGLPLACLVECHALRVAGWGRVTARRRRRKGNTAANIPKRFLVTGPCVLKKTVLKTVLGLCSPDRFAL